MSLYKTVLSFGLSVAIFGLTTLSTIAHASESKDPQVVIPHVTQKVLKSIEIEQVKEKTLQLTTNKEALEKFAREHYLMKKKDEVIYVFDDL